MVKSKKADEPKDVDFPPLPASRYTVKAMVTACAKRMEPSAVEEAGCSVCAQLVPTTELLRLKSVKNFLHALEMPGVTRQIRKTDHDPIKSIPGPVIDRSISRICSTCRTALRKDQMPKNALARRLWIGEVPPELQDLRFVEKLVIARVWYSNCFVRVSSGFRKMIANALAFESPVPKIYA
ncbi:hypothetical protein BDN71DRAFT_1396020 [Pleurotus eryngii]|uniref:DUF6570 domain-containing protein n=1 Tax=Pleurotus eryngii TaxID=5323 RepID=A0A9P5ZQY2_PLEER|nr:hypothetical protein BDN71DRAFT_1396020 [Pleurotus eryngii]